VKIDSLCNNQMHYQKCGGIVNNAIVNFYKGLQ
jgi:hypothetical protein